MMSSSPAMPRKNARKGSSGQNIKVFVRCRHMNATEKRDKAYSVVECQSREVVVRERPMDKFTKTFTFDRVFGPESKQIDVYRAVAKNCVDEVLSGFNCTIFAYGQTGTGKTFTMEGEHTNAQMSWEEDPLLGIIPRCVNQLFDELRIQKVEFTMRVSFLELYNEELFDLLSAHDDMSKLRMYEDSARKGSCIIQGLEEVLVRSKSDVYDILEKGTNKRQTAATLMNAHSSRSHTVFTVTVHIKENTTDGDELLKTGKLHLVDLAGSENIGRSGAVDKRAREAGNINMSLLTLGRVITALVEKAPHVPYRESKLTRLLQDALGGRTKTSIIATISPASCNLDETLSTLDYAHRAKNIQNKPEVNQKLNKKELIGEYSEEIERLRRDLMAMREKNGVYLANENYQEIMTTMETQAKEICEKIAQIRTMEEELEKKTALFDKVSGELGETQDKLGKTEEMLSSTQTLLHTTAQHLEEHKYLVDQHSKTEERLKEQGKKLLDVADTTTGDISRLQDKLDRKRAVEAKNQDSEQRFLQVQADVMEGMRMAFGEALDTHTEAATNTSSKLEGMMKAHGTNIRATNEKLSGFAKEQNETTDAIMEMFKTKVEEDLASTKELVSGLMQLCGQQEAHLGTFQKDQIQPAMERLATLISSQATTVTDLFSFLANKLREVGEDTTKHREEQERLRSGFEADMSTGQEDTASRIQGCVTNVEALQKYTCDQLEVLPVKIKEFETMLNNLAKTSTDAFTNIFTELEDLRSMNTKVMPKVNTYVDSSREHDVSHVATVQELTTQAKDRMDDVNDELEKNLAAMGGERCSVESVVAQYGAGVDQLVAQTRTAATHYQDQAQSRATRDMDAHMARLQEIKSLAASLEKENADLESEISQVERECAEVQAMSASAMDTLVTFGQSHADNLTAYEGQVSQYFTEKLVRDVPTGTTPTRREYTFSRLLSSTSPHERLLARYRTATTGTASKLELPSFDDTEDEMSSAETSRVSQCDEVEEEVGGRSRSGSVSSTKGDSGFLVPAPPGQEDNSNVSRCSSTSSIPELKDKENSLNRRGSKKREIKPPSIVRSSSSDNVTRGRRILAPQN